MAHPLHARHWNYACITSTKVSTDGRGGLILVCFSDNQNLSITRTSNLTVSNVLNYIISTVLSHIKIPGRFSCFYSMMTLYFIYFIRTTTLKWTGVTDLWKQFPPISICSTAIQIPSRLKGHHHAHWGAVETCRGRGGACHWQAFENVRLQPCSGRWPQRVWSL